MIMRKFLAISVGVLVLSAGLVLMSQDAGADNPHNPPPPPPTDLSGVTPNWDKNLPSTSRFTVLSAFNNAAVRDNNTGLVWEKAPTNEVNARFQLGFSCARRTVGGLLGWRLPSVAELASLIDPSLPAPFVPTNVFTGVQLGRYWSSTYIDFSFSAEVWVVDFSNGNVNFQPNNFAVYAWCVRGPMQESVY